MTNRFKLYAGALALTLLVGWLVYPAFAAPSRSRAVFFLFDDATSVTANNDIMSADVTPQFSGSVLRITVVLPIASVLNVTSTDGSTTVTSGLNASSALNAGDTYTFDVPCTPSLSYNLQPETTQSSGIDYLVIHEVKE